MLEENILTENQLRNILICLFVLHADLNKLRLTIDNLEFENQKNKHEIQMKNLIYDGYSYKKIDSDEEVKEAEVEEIYDTFTDTISDTDIRAAKRMKANQNYNQQEMKQVDEDIDEFLNSYNNLIDKK